MVAAEKASGLKAEDTAELIKLLKAKDSAVRYWAAMGLLMRGEKGVAQGEKALRNALNDESPEVACMAAEALGRYGKGRAKTVAIDTLMKYADVSKNTVFTSMLALNGLDYTDNAAKDQLEAINQLPSKGAVTPARMGNYVPNLLSKIKMDLGGRVEVKPKRPRKNRK